MRASVLKRSSASEKLAFPTVSKLEESHPSRFKPSFAPWELARLAVFDTRFRACDAWACAIGKIDVHAGMRAMAPRPLDHDAPAPKAEPALERKNDTHAR